MAFCTQQSNKTHSQRPLNINLKTLGEYLHQSLLAMYAHVRGISARRCYIYNHKKRATLFSIVTPAFLVDFYNFVPVERGRNDLQFTYLMT